MTMTLLKSLYRHESFIHYNHPKVLNGHLYVEAGYDNRGGGGWSWYIYSLIPCWTNRSPSPADPVSLTLGRGGGGISSANYHGISSFFASSVYHTK